MDLTNKIVLITGASAGIGEACAETFASNRAKLILIARREEILKKLSKKLSDKYGTECYLIVCDIRNHKQLEAKFEAIPDCWKNIDILINNAGLARNLDKIQEGAIQDWEEMIDTNIKGLLFASRLILPGMVERNTGHVINIGSIAGREVYAGGSVYCASKHAVKAISKGMAIDLNGTGVRITNIDPGLVETEFALVRFDGDQEKAANVYKGYQPLIGSDIAEVALFAATRPPHVAIQDILITPTDQANAYLTNKKL